MQTHNHDITKREIKTLINKSDDLPINVLEVGCNNGKDSLEFLQFPGPNFRLYCFECDQRAIAKFKQAVTDPRCQLFETAVSDKDGETTFFMSGGRPPGYPQDVDWDMSGSIRKPTGHLKMSPWCTFNRNIVVPTIRLDTWAEQHPECEIVDFLWADVQGAEVDVINGGKELLKRTRFMTQEWYAKPQYAGQISLQEMLRMLGNDWELVATYGDNNALFRNKRL